MKRLIFILIALSLSFFAFANESDEILINCENTEASVYINGEFVGTTPYVISDYTFPLTVLMKAEGFTDRVFTLNEYTAEKEVELFSVEIDRNYNFKKAKKSFYWSFARSLALVGVNAATRSFFEEGSKQYKTTNIIMTSLIGVSVAETGYRLYKYFKSAKDLVY